MNEDLTAYKILRFCEELSDIAKEANKSRFGLNDQEKDLYIYFVYSVYRLKIISPEQCKEFIKNIDFHTYNVILEAEAWKQRVLENVT